MYLFNWTRAFEDRKVVEDIPKRVRRTEIQYWFWLVICVGIGLWGMNILINAPQDNLKMHLIGLFLAMVGLVDLAIIKIVTHSRLIMYRIIWDQQNRIRMEQERMHSTDL